MSDRINILLNERYCLDAEIGRGGMGVVYRGHDTLLKRDVAVKVLSATSLSSESHARLLREAQATAQLNHPNIVSVHDAGEAEMPARTGTVPFIVMELVEGQSLHECPPGSLEEVMGVACQVCAALDHAHGHDIIHRDLKPENVLRAPDGTAKLVDFGLARTVASRLTTEGAILGTLLYLAPEQAQGGEIDGRADLYALGVMLYEWTTGRPPFEGDDPVLLIGQHLHTPVVAPREHDAEIPAALNALIVRLLSKRAEDRPATAAEVQQALQALAQGETPREQAGECVNLPGFLLDEAREVSAERPVFVARERELARLGGFLAEALAGQGRVAFVTGGPGRGKTALLGEFARRAMEEHPDLLVASGTCNAYSGVGDPYLPFREVLGMLTSEVETRWEAGAVSSDQARRLWQALPGALEALLAHGPHMVPALLPGEALLARAEMACPGAPWLERLRERVERGRAGTDRLEQSHLFQQVSNVLHALAEAHPLLLILDDLQWADRASIGLLFHLGRRLEGARILIAGAYRPEEVALGVEDGQRGERERHPLEKVLAEFKRIYGDVWLDLAGVEEPEGRQFVEALLETEPNRLGEDFRQSLAERAGGHPLFTVELLRAMQERGDLVRDGAGRWVEGPTLDWEAMPARVEGVIAARIERLGEDLREILTVASVEGEDFTAEVVGQVRSMETRELVRRLSGELQKEHRLVRARGLRHLDARRLALYRFQHHLFQKYLYNSLDEVERAYLHEDVGTVLEALYGGQRDEVAVQLARHFLEAGVRDKAAHYLGRAGEQAAAKYANEEAVAHLSRALVLVPETDRAERYKLLLARERVHDVMGQRVAQRGDLAELELLAEGLGAEQQAEVAVQRAGYASQRGDYPATVDAAQVAVERAHAAGNVRLQAQGHLEWGIALFCQSDNVAALEQYETALKLAQEARLRDVEADALRRLGAFWRSQEKPIAARDYLEQALGLYRQNANLFGEGDILCGLGMLAVDRGDYAAAQAYFERTLRITREIENRRGEMQAFSSLAWVCAFVGDYQRMRGCNEQALRLAREVEDRSMESFALSGLGEALRYLGDGARACLCCEQALEIAREIGDPSAVTDALLLLGHAYRDVGDLATARGYYEEVLELYHQIDAQHFGMEVLASLACAALSLGDLDEAQDRVAEILLYLDEGGTLSVFDMPFFVYLACYRVLQAAGDPRAEEILDTAHGLLMEQADRTGDEAMRRSFLENVPWNREIVEITRELWRPGVDGSAPA